MSLSVIDVTIVTKQPSILKAMKQDTVITRQSMGIRPQVGGGKRSNITKLSRASLRRMKLHFRNMPEPSHMITLTYPGTLKNNGCRVDLFTKDGQEVKRHFTAMKKWLIRHGVTSGAWFLEFQARGAPHFHIFVNNAVDVEKLAAAWIRIVLPTFDHLNDGSLEFAKSIQQALDWHVGGILVGRDKDGVTRTNRPCIEPLRVKHAASAYATSYAAKAEQKRAPNDYKNVGRFWGAWGDYRHKESEVFGSEADAARKINHSEVANVLAATRTIRSVRKLLKTRGYKVNDEGHYGYVAWGVGVEMIDKLMTYYKESW